jgi:hypothetical protein
MVKLTQLFWGVIICSLEHSLSETEGTKVEANSTSAEKTDEKNFILYSIRRELFLNRLYRYY